MQTAISVSVRSFGVGRRILELPLEQATVGEAIRQAGFQADSRRLALNGNVVDSGATIQEGDFLTLVPKIVGG